MSEPFLTPFPSPRLAPDQTPGGTGRVVTLATVRIIGLHSASHSNEVWLEIVKDGESKENTPEFFEGRIPVDPEQVKAILELWCGNSDQGDKFTLHLRRE